MYKDDERKIDISYDIYISYENLLLTFLRKKGIIQSVLMFAHKTINLIIILLL